MMNSNFNAVSNPINISIYRAKRRINFSFWLRRLVFNKGKETAYGSYSLQSERIENYLTKISHENIIFIEKHFLSLENLRFNLEMNVNPRLM